MVQSSAIELKYTILSMLQSIDCCSKPIVKPSILWNHTEIKTHEYSKRSKGSTITIIQGSNDVLCGIKYTPQGNLENVVIKRFIGFYTKRAEEFTIILKRSIKDHHINFLLCGYIENLAPSLCNFLIGFFETSDAVFDDLKISINSLCRSDASSILNTLS